MEGSSGNPNPKPPSITFTPSQVFRRVVGIAASLADFTPPPRLSLAADYGQAIWAAKPGDVLPDGSIATALVSTPLGGAESFRYSEDLPDGDAEQIAGMPYNGAPNSWASSMPGTMPQLRQYGPGGTPMTDIDFEAHHGHPNPHAHNWDGTARDEGAPVSILPW